MELIVLGLVIALVIATIVLARPLFGGTSVKHEPATRVEPRPITSDDFGIVWQEASYGGPIITLVSGERLVVEEALLYDVNKVAEFNSLKAYASNELQGFTTGLGFWGSPGWVIGGALALGAVEGMISNAKQKNGLRLLKLAAEKFNQLPNNSVFVSINRICNLQTPNPQSWSAMTSIGSARFIHNGEDFVTVRTADGGITFRWSQVASYVPPREAQPLLPVPAAA
jgi:hypothetical protein